MTSIKQTFVYKTVDDCEIKADVYCPAHGAKRPLIVWIHGGALMLGGRGNVSDHLDIYLNAGYALVSIDYRLAPETKLPAIIEDVQDAFRWIRGDAAKQFGFDTERLAVIGHSAGGYLTLMTGFRIEPRPKALISFYGYGDIDGPWYAQPDPFYRSLGMIPESEALGAITDHAISEAPAQDKRSHLYRYCRQHGIWPRMVTGFDPHTDRVKFDPYCPVRNVDRDFPPTLLLHGDKDADVPYELSVAMAKELKRVGVEHELFTVPGGGHGFDPTPCGGFDRVLSFLKCHLK